jgi:hypothetical protein
MYAKLQTEKYTQEAYYLSQFTLLFYLIAFGVTNRQYFVETLLNMTLTRICGLAKRGEQA